MSSILLAGINAKYIHSSLGLRYLKANLGDLASQCEIQEFTIQTRPLDIIEAILVSKPKIIGFGVYIWNVREVEAVICQLKVVAPDVVIILGGPEISYETESQSISHYADYVLTGAADQSFKKLCLEILQGTPPEKKILKSAPLQLNDLEMPYQLFSDNDLKHRLLYVEASRGCPFKCEFCLSSLDKTSYPFDLSRFLAEMDKLYSRGARHFKFVDRTFNLKVATTLTILDFFYERLTDDLFLHFEVIPDHLPEKLKVALARFPEGCLQFEVGIQTFNQEVQTHISRKQDNEKSKQNLLWLREHTQAHIHADLIFGLPGETLASFKDSFDQLYACRPHEIQMGILKRLRGSPIIRHTQTFDLRFNPLPPYNILANDRVDFTTLQRVNRFARYWDLVGNSGRFKHALPELLSPTAFDDFMAFSDWTYQHCGQTHQINLAKLFELIAQACQDLFPERYAMVLEGLAKDFADSKLKGYFHNLQLERKNLITASSQNKRSARQQRHLPG